jgi:hypothetical protein
MKKTLSFLIFCALLLLPAVAIFAVRHHHLTASTQVLADAKSAPSVWVSCAYHLEENETQTMADIEDSHRAKCAELCVEYFQTQDEVHELARDMDASEAALTAASARLSECHLKCQDLSLLHVREVARLLPEDDRENYLATTVPAILGASSSSHNSNHHH